MNCLSPVNPGHLRDETYPITDFSCLKTAVSAYITSCGSISEFAFSFLSVLKNACEEGISASEISAALESICQETEALEMYYTEGRVEDDREDQSCGNRVETGFKRLIFKD
jgi:hypothetical protein